MRKILLALSPAILGLGLYACAGSPTAPSGMNDLSSGGSPARTEATVGNTRQFDNPVDADAVEIGPDGQSLSKAEKDKAAKEKAEKEKAENDKAANENSEKNDDSQSNNAGGSQTPSLLTSVSSVDPGGNVIVTMRNGSGGANQWIALAPVNAPDTSYLLSIQVGPGVTARVWTVRMPMTPGGYEFRLFLKGNRGYALRGGARDQDAGLATAVPTQNTRVATSGTVTVMSSTTPPVIVNDPMPPESANDGPVAGNDPPAVVDEQPAPAPPVVDEPAPPPPPPPVVVEPTPPPPPPPPVVEPPPSTDPAISVSSQSVTGGTSMSATLTNGLGGPFDWLTYAPVGSPDSEYWSWTYVPGGLSTYTWTFSVPAVPGTYEIRLLLNGGYTKVATSAPITVK